MENKYNTVIDDAPTMLHEPSPAYALQSQQSMRKVDIQELMTEGYMTLEQSKTLIEEKIYNHFHTRWKVSY